MPLNRYDITILQGETFRKHMVWSNASGTPIDLTSHTARMHIRRTVSDPEIALELTTENARIALGGVTGTIDLVIAALDTSTLEGEFVYDLELVNGADVQRVLQGKAFVNPEVTR